MRTAPAVVAFLLIVTSLPALGQSRDPSDRALGAEMSRDRAESRIERLRRDKEQKEDAAAKPGTERTTTPREDRERRPPR
jgi:hypothetical protein